MAVRNPRHEAYVRLGGAYEVRVLEPPPPAVGAPDWSDDPAARGEVPEGRRVVSPVVTGDLTWEDIAEDDRELAEWCRKRWLAAWGLLPPVPRDWPAKRAALHVVAEHVLAPARYVATGRIGLRWTLGGFGTPYFERDGRDCQVRVDGVDLVLALGEEERREPITTPGRAAEFVEGPLGAPAGVYEPESVLAPEALLDVDADSVRFVSDWFGFAYSVLEELRAETPDWKGPSRVQIWPEHFDAAFEFGNEEEGRRAAYGASPGDASHPDPYLYVAPWAVVPDHPVWDARSFRGALLPYRELFHAHDQRALALGFFRGAAAVLDAL
ncbi:MAG: hypothetical protein DYH08_10790 [Actinobacteria bacterium ATB1]|nr:hypothetical protein [Actinobacteria bacterium ATB1]